MRAQLRDWRLPALAAGGFIFARLTGGRLPYFLFYSMGLAVLCAYLWTRHAASRINCLIQVEKERVEVGESFAVKVRLDNDAVLPIPWVEVDDETPKNLVANETPGQATSVPLMESRVIPLRLTARRRGHYHIGPVRVRLGDAMGLFASECAFTSQTAVTVYPRVHPIDNLPIPLSQPFGPTRTQERAFEDPSNHAEIRPYRPGDNPRYIHWKTSARRGELMMRQYELNATTQMTIFVDLHGAAHTTGEVLTEEVAVELAASLAALGLRRKIDVGLVCHGRERASVHVGRGQRTFHEILEVLARAEATSQVPLEQVLEAEAAHLTAKSTLVVITPRLSSPLAELLIRLRARHQVMLVLVEGDDAPTEADRSLTGLLSLRRVALYRVPPGADLRRLAEMRITTAGEGVRAWSNGAPQPVTNFSFR